jgi:FAD/FMN-containing dehydrogenase
MTTAPSKPPGQNFGGNVVFAPQRFYMPRDEAELLEILRRHPDRRFRAVGRLHSWNAALYGEDVVIDLRHFDAVTVRAGDEPWAEVGAGCQIKRLLAELLRQGYTTMSQGLIKEQALAGAAATATHGSGKHSLAHYIDAVRLARFDRATGEPRIDEIDGGPALAAARCSLGCLGIVTSLRIPIRRVYFIEEHFRRHATLAEVLQAEEDYPLQQFYLVPWRWDFYAQHRREVDRPRSRLAPLYRLYWSVGMDVVFHWVVIALARWLPALCAKIFYRWVLPALVPRGWKVVDHSDRQLSMAHERFRHIETEIFVPRSRLAEAIAFVALALRHAGGERVVLPPEFERQLIECELKSQWDELHGCYRQHYPICIRKVLPDDALLSMSSGAEPRYAISIISYVAVSRRAGFFRVADFLIQALGKMFDGRPHWGKYGNLSRSEAERLYPQLDAFREIVAERDPAERFMSAGLQPVLGKG